MRGMNGESADLIYLDPPFNSKANYAAPIGSKAAGAAFKDTWTLRDVDAEWINLIEAKHPALHRVLLAAMTASDKSYLASPMENGAGWLWAASSAIMSVFDRSRGGDGAP